jgi:hypothetical protein
MKDRSYRSAEKTLILCQFQGFRLCDYSYCGLVDFDNVQSIRLIPMLRRNIMDSFPGSNCVGWRISGVIQVTFKDTGNLDLRKGEEIKMWVSRKG